MLWIAAALLLALVMLLFLIAPNRKRRRADGWRGTAFAHRGLHNENVCENTLEAFERACLAGVGIELDVQLTRDGELVVFHDADLERLMGDARKVAHLTLAQLRAYRLPDGSRIPTLQEALRLVNGRAPLLVELKNGKRMRELCEKTHGQLRAYSGRYIVESFQPLILLWFRLHAREMIRGQLVAAREEYLEDYGGFLASVMVNLLCNCFARPDFVAYDLRGEEHFGLKLQRRLFHTPMAVWTVKSREACSAAIRKGEMSIFEGFLPDNVKLEDAYEL